VSLDRVRDRRERAVQAHLVAHLRQASSCPKLRYASFSVIAQETIETIRDRANIADIIGVSV
jgi:hypothetical protein